jgi:hypothetical protein
LPAHPLPSGRRGTGLVMGEVGPGVPVLAVSSRTVPHWRSLRYGPHAQSALPLGLLGWVCSTSVRLWSAMALPADAFECRASPEVETPRLLSHRQVG